MQNYFDLTSYIFKNMNPLLDWHQDLVWNLLVVNLFSPFLIAWRTRDVAYWAKCKQWKYVWQSMRPPPMDRLCSFGDYAIHFILILIFHFLCQFQTYPPFPDQTLMGALSQYQHADVFINTQGTQRKLGTLSKSEWEAASKFITAITNTYFLVFASYNIYYFLNVTHSLIFLQLFI